jgi:hypothetical protein
MPTTADVCSPAVVAQRIASAEIGRVGEAVGLSGRVANYPPGRIWDLDRAAARTHGHEP